MNLIIYFHLLYINLSSQYFVGWSGIKNRETSDNSKNMPEIQSYNPKHILKQQSSEDNENINNFKNDKGNKNIVNPMIVEYKEFLRNNERIQNDMLLEFHFYLFNYDINEKNSKIICNVYNSLKDEEYFLSYLRYFITSLISINEKK